MNIDISLQAPTIVIHQSDEVLASMNEWCIDHHGRSGLTEACRQSTTTEQQAEDVLLSFVQAYTPPKKCPLAGNTVHMDRLFIGKFENSRMN